LGDEASIDRAKGFRRKWTDEEVRIVIQADPTKDSYQKLAKRFHRTPGGIRMKRSIMIDLFKHEDVAREKAKLAQEDPKPYHKYFDFGHVDRILRELGYYKKPFTEQWELACHLQQPSSGWRGDGTQAVLAKRRKQARAIKQLAKNLANDKPRKR